MRDVDGEQSIALVTEERHQLPDVLLHGRGWVELAAKESGCTAHDPVEVVSMRSMLAWGDPGLLS